MGDTIQFVDSIASSPTTLLDLNDLDTVGSGFGTRVFSAPPPQLRRSLSQNTMRDGIYVSASNYDARTVTLELDVKASSQDNLATEWQTLARIVDGQTAILKYQPSGATSPAFFKVFRSDYSSVQDVNAATAWRQVTLNLLCEPFALGLRETISVGTVNNDPAAGSNGCYFDVAAASCKGDVAAPIVFVDTGTLEEYGVLAVRQHGTVTDLPVVIQCESMTASVDTANPGGGPDANMSGSGTNNYMLTTFATEVAMDTRLTYNTTTAATLRALQGTFRAFVTVDRAAFVGTTIVRMDTLGANGDYNPGQAVTLLGNSSRNIVDLGLFTFGTSPNSAAPGPFDIQLLASSSAGDDLSWDCLQLVPADESMALAFTSSFTDAVYDGEDDRVYSVANGANLFTSGTTEDDDGIAGGSIPRLRPNQVNRFFYIKHDGGAISKSVTGSVTIYYLPRYLHVRPAST